MSESAPQPDRRRSAARRTALLVALLAVGVYVAFFVRAIIAS